MKIINKYRPEMFFVIILLLVSVSCGSKPTQSAQIPSTGEQNQVVATTVDSQESLPEATDLPEPTPTLVPTLVPTLAPTAVPVGFSRAEPHKITDIVTNSTWNVQVLEMQRGEEAWIVLQSTSSNNQPAPEGFEFLSIKLKVEITSTKNSSIRLSSCSFAVTGDDLMSTSCGQQYIYQPVPVLEGEVFSGGLIEGWVTYIIPKELAKLILIVKDPDAQSASANQYVALDDGASIIVPADLASIVPNDVGKDRNNPALKTDTIITIAWQFSILEVIRGQAAYDRILADYPFSGPPDTGMEYILVKSNIKRINNTNWAASIYNGMFGTSGSKGILYEVPITFNAAKPTVDVDLFSGGEIEGWFTLQMPIDEGNAVLVFNRSDKTDMRFISLE
jgi:hypothetical protein